MAGMRAGQVELTLQIGERDVEIDHGHLGRVMAEQFHQGRNINAATEHLAGNLLSKGVPIPVTAKIYSHALPDDNARAAEAWEKVLESALNEPEPSQTATSDLNVPPNTERLR